MALDGEKGARHGGGHEKQAKRNGGINMMKKNNRNKALMFQ